MTLNDEDLMTDPASDDSFDSGPDLAISVVSVGGWRADGSSVPSMRSAICDTCGKWATKLAVAGESKHSSDEPRDVDDARISRSTIVVVYTCDDHWDEIAEALGDEFGGCSNLYEADGLAKAVDEHQQREFRAGLSD
jgi:hypothetical protein